LSENPLNNITKIGNYALPAFGAFLTATFSISTVKWEDSRGQHIMVAFAIYTMLAAFVSYYHRILWLRHQNKQRVKGIEESKLTGLPSICIVLFLALHFLLIVFLALLIYILSK